MGEASKCSVQSDFDIGEENKRKLQFIEDVTSNADRLQKEVLAEILSSNANVEYLQRHGLHARTDPDTFKKLIPVVSYDGIVSDIKRIANGDSSPILSSKPFSVLLSSTGSSSGEPKLLPTNDEDLERRVFMRSLLIPIMSQFVPNLEKGKGMYFSFSRSETKTPGGIVVSPSTTRFYRSSYFQTRPYYLNYTSPNETILCTDSYQSMYSQMLCGLLQHRQVLWVGAAYASGFLRAIRFLQKHWPLLSEDIRTGTLHSQIADPSVRQAVLKILKPDPELADLVQLECSKSSWKGIIPSLWPNAKYIDVIVTGIMSQYIPVLDFYSNSSLPLVCPRYFSSECCFGVNLHPLSKPDEVSYTLMPNMCYYEFLPVQKDNRLISDSLPVTKFMITENELIEQQELVDLVDVKLGHEYEIVVTTYPGLYRYRVGDILRVTGFKNKAPQFSFVCRKNVMLSIDLEMTDEVDLHNAIQNASKHLTPYDATVAEYTSYADTSKITGHYVIYWELNLHEPKLIPSSVMEDCCLTIEESLSSRYRQVRACDELIGPLEIKIVEAGTFEKLMDYAIGLGASISQYKTPRCVKTEPIVELLNSRTVSSYVSPK